MNYKATLKSIKLTVGLGLTVMCFSSTAQNLQVESKWWEPDGPVHAIHKADGVVYVGGDFDNVAANRPYGVPISLSSGNPNMGFPVTNGNIYVAEKDGNGGWYIGGDFTNIDGQTRNRLAHIDSDGQLTSWNPNVSSGFVYDIAVSGSTVYVGGQFTNIGGSARMNIASLNATTGAVNSWNPGANLAVRTIAVSGTTVYVGGNFAQLAGVSRFKLGAVSATTGVATAWDPQVIGDVYDIIVDGSTVYACGSFNIASGVTRNNIAAFSTAGVGNETSWNPNANGAVYDMELVNDTLYFGGAFNSVGFSARNRIAAIKTDGTVTTFNPNANGIVRTVQVSGGNAYFGGEFTVVGGWDRNRLAAADCISGTVQSWDPRANNTVHTLSVDGNRVYAGGEFTNLGLTERQGIVALDEQTGTPISWNPQVIGAVYAIEKRDGIVYVGGAFNNVDFTSRNNLAAINASGNLVFWMPAGANDDVHALKFSQDTLYIGGSFTSIGGQSRNYLAAALPSSLNPLAWNPDPNALVRSLEVASNRVFAGGEFTTMNGTGRTCLAAFELGTGTLDAFSKNITGMVPSVYTMSASNSKLFIAGAFSSVDFNTRNNAAAIDLATDGLDSWNPNASSLVRAVASGDRSVFVGGAFDAVGGQSRDWLAELDSTTASAQSWNPSPYNQVITLLADENIIYIGGFFVRDVSSPFKHDYFAVYSRCAENGSTLSITAVNSYTVPSGDETYEASGTYLDTLPNYCGMDSILSINLVILPCGMPTDPMVSNITDTSAILSWTGGVFGADRYQMRWRAVGETDWQARNTFDEQGYRHVKAFEPDTEYEWIIRTRCGVGNGDSSEWVSGPNFTTLAGCGPVQDVTISNITQTQVDASWPNHAGATEYLLRFKPTSASEWRAKRVDGTTTSTTLRNLLPATEYEYRLRVYCETGLSRRGELVNFTTASGPGSRLAASEEEQQSTELILYPNPTQGDLTIEFGSDVENASVEVINALGQTVYSKGVTGTDRIQLTTDLQSGVYLISVTIGAERKMVKLLVE